MARNGTERHLYRNTLLATLYQLIIVADDRSRPLEIQKDATRHLRTFSPPFISQTKPSSQWSPHTFFVYNNVYLLNEVEDFHDILYIAWSYTDTYLTIIVLSNYIYLLTYSKK